jgi:hypothetical protein
MTALLIALEARAVEEPASSPGLPPIECVQMLRTGRDMLEIGDRQGGVKLLRETVGRFPEEVVALAAQLGFRREFGRREEQLQLCFVVQLFSPAVTEL